MSTMKQWKSLTLQLRKIFDDLPTAVEREDIVSSIKNLQRVLDDLSKSVSSLPTVDEASKARESLARLENIVSSNPLLRGYTAKRSPKVVSRKPKSGAPGKPPPIIPNVSQIIERLSAMPEASLRHELNDSNNLSNNTLKVVLTHLGRKVPSKNTRREMVEQLIVTIVNRRTYQGLRGE